MTKIDIFIPYWGDFDLLKEAVESVQQQTYVDWRLVVVDDCYPSDDTQHYFSSLSDDRVKYIRHKENIGITNNFNYCLEQVDSDYCMLLGCDDRLLPNYLERALFMIGHADLYQPSVEVIDRQGKVYHPLADKIKELLRPSKPGYYSGEKLATSLCHGNWLYFPSILWKTQTLKQYRFDAQYSILEDVVVELKMVIDGAILSVEKWQPTFQYRRFADSLSSKEKKKGGVRFDEEKTVYDEFSKKFLDVGWTKAARAAKMRITSRIHSFISKW